MSAEIPGAAELAGARVAVVGLGKSGAACVQALAEATEAVVSAWDANESALENAGDVDERGAAADPAALAEKALAWKPDVVIPAPAVPEVGPLFEQASRAGVPVWSEIELAWRLRAFDGGRAAPWLCVTGTNGKTTAVSMAEAILDAGGLKGKAVGNVGNPAVAEVSRTDGGAAGAFAVELSSFQLRTTRTMSPLASICLNIADDHLEWHGSREAYWRAKARVYERVQAACIYPVGDSSVQRMVDQADVVEGARAVGLSLGVPSAGQIGLVEDAVVDRAFGPGRFREAIELFSLGDLAQLAPAGADLPVHIVWDAMAAAALGRAFPADGAGDDAVLEAILTRGLTPTVPTDYERWRCLHWPLAVPEVMERGGFDAIVGNPPFLGAKKLSPSMGKNLREWCVHVIANRVGNADIVAYFFLRAFSLINEHGTLGLIATNSVAQGDTREVGLDQMVDSGFTITRAIQSRSWPSRSANLEFAAVWGTRDAVSSRTTMVCDDAPVSRISSLLEPTSRAEGKPERLVENSGVAFQGCIVLGRGFVLEPEEAQEWIAEDPRNAEVLFPYLNGEDLNSRPDCSASRWVIDFNERSQGESQRYVLPWRRALIEVRPERVVKDVKKYPRMVNEWWKYWNSRPAMRKAIADLDEVLLVARVSKTVMPMRVPTGPVMSDATVVFATDSYSEQAVLSSSVHQDWVITYGSTLETRVRYTPSDVFETFPRPEPTPELEAIGRTLDAERREIMLRRSLGLTRLYNLVNDPGLEAGVDPDVDRMRDIHVELDAAVAAAYGWDGLYLTHGFHNYRQMTRWTVAPVTRVEILDRLLEENHRRAAAEAPGRSAPGGSGSRRTRGRKSAKAVQIPVQEATLDI